MTIVRDMSLADGGESWVLLSQVEHARVSGELAECWASPELVPRDEIVGTLFHHDDGWADWERQPGVDVESGRPIAFTEMPDDAKYAIWRASVERTRALGALQGAIVAWHFIELPRGTNRWQETAGDLGAAAESFIKEYSALADGWLTEWLAEDTANTKEAARRALEWLQMFDVVSLWLCMAESRESRTIGLPGGANMVFNPKSLSQICVKPWPFREDRVRLEIEGRRVPVRRYADAADLAAEPGDSVRLSWELTAGRD